MKHKSNNYNHLTKSEAIALVEAKWKHATEREKRATRLLDALSSEYRATRGVPDGIEISAADRALLSAAASAQLEIETTTAQFAAGRASSKALERLGNARGEMRRTLQALGLITSDGETGTNGDAPPPNATEEERREWSRRYVERPFEVKVAAP
jgi:hypothetical protein